MQESLNVFEAFYLSKHNGRRLQWQNSVGHCVLKAFFNRGRKELDVSLVQCVVMLLFKEESSISFLDIKEAVGAEEQEIKRTLQSLACGRIRVLQKKPKVSERRGEELRK
jgi:cullin 4